MSFARAKFTPDVKVSMPTSRVGKLALIRETFAAQPLGGWDAGEQNEYLKSIGLGATQASKARTDEEIDFIIADLIRHRLVLIK